MTWQSLGTFEITNTWILTDVISTELFRIQHVSVVDSTSDMYFRALIAQGFDDDGINIFAPQRLTYREEKEILYLPLLKGLTEQRLAFKRLDKSPIPWQINIEVFQSSNVMFYSSVNKQQATNAQPANDVSVTTSKTLVVSEKADGSRHSCLFTNTGPSTAYFKYVPLGTDPTANTVIVSATVYDFLLAPSEKFLDDNSSQNAVVGICTGVVTTTAKVKVTEYIYS
ncbi:MAG: hypothetical protein RMX59_035145 [Nostoc sp. DedSLP05]|nr:hypothetical protein [Nostoc sp. DedSLP05]MDZ8102084.1 hypothetical protein [Nostoc sp. DedSLP01]